MDYDSIAKAGSMLGSGAVIVMDDSRCMVKCLLRLSYFYMHESCGQCTPCREGTGWLWRMVDRIEHGQGRHDDLDLLNSVADNIQGRTICALGDAAAMPVRAMIKHFRARVRGHDPEHVPDGASPRPEEQKHNTWSKSNSTARRSVAEGSMVMHAADEAGTYIPHFCYHKKLTHRGQLPHVPGRGREGAQADAGLRHAGHQRHDRAHQERQGDEGAAVGDGVPAHQPPAGLPDLRPGRRMPAAGSGGRLRRLRPRATRKKSASSSTRTWAR